MEFGRVEENELYKIDFKLPNDPATNQQFLSGKPDAECKVYGGCAKWGRAEWVGKIYPEKTREKDFLKYYVEHFNSIELNATHYRIFGPIAVQRWAAKAEGKDFLFCPKMHQGVTHRGRLNERTFLLNEFLRGVVAFENHLGPILIQFNETFSPKRRNELFDFLAALPTHLQFVAELRHPRWFADDKTKDELFSKLTELRIGSVITDTAGRRDCAHMRLTTPKAFVRFVGNDLHETDFPRIDNWVNRIKLWLDNGINQVYFFIHMHDEAKSPDLTAYLIDRLNDVCELKLHKPQFIGSTAPLVNRK